jgi:hypothetical protein
VTARLFSQGRLALSRGRAACGAAPLRPSTQALSWGRSRRGLRQPTRNPRASPPVTVAAAPVTTALITAVPPSTAEYRRVPPSTVLDDHDHHPPHHRRRAPLSSHRRTGPPPRNTEKRCCGHGEALQASTPPLARGAAGRAALDQHVTTAVARRASTTGSRRTLMTYAAGLARMGARARVHVHGCTCAAHRQTRRAEPGPRPRRPPAPRATRCPARARRGAARHGRADG